MREVLNYFKYTLRQSAVSLALFLVIPLSIPYVVFVIINVFAAVNDDIRIDNLEVQNLPQP